MEFRPVVFRTWDWNANVTFAYANPPMAEGDRYRNPLGFQVQNYRFDPGVVRLKHWALRFSTRLHPFLLPMRLRSRVALRLTHASSSSIMRKRRSIASSGPSGQQPRLSSARTKRFST